MDLCLWRLQWTTCSLHRFVPGLEFLCHSSLHEVDVVMVTLQTDLSVGFAQSEPVQSQVTLKERLT